MQLSVTDTEYGITLSQAITTSRSISDSSAGNREVVTVSRSSTEPKDVGLDDFIWFIIMI